jgi:hypothetical protein
MEIRKAEDIPESAHLCLLLVEFVSCNGRCRMCSVEYLRDRRSVAGGC